MSKLISPEPFCFLNVDARNLKISHMVHVTLYWTVLTKNNVWHILLGAQKILHECIHFLDE
jgi:hypothetical protein